MLLVEQSLLFYLGLQTNFYFLVSSFGLFIVIGFAWLGIIWLMLTFSFLFFSSASRVVCGPAQPTGPVLLRTCSVVVFSICPCKLREASLRVPRLYLNFPFFVGVLSRIVIVV